MPKTIISDTSCLIILTNIDELHLLRDVYGQVTTTKEVADEFGQPLPEWVRIQSPTDKHKQHILELQVDRGEASAIALALETNESVLILDDYRARRIAANLGLDFIGTIGIIVRAKTRGFVKSIKPYLEKIKQTNFRISDEIEKRALEEAGEI